MPPGQSSQPISRELDLLGCELAKANRELETTMQQVLRDARAMLATLVEDASARTARPGLSRPANRLFAAVRRFAARPALLRRLLLVAATACLCLVAAHAAIDTFRHSGSTLHAVPAASEGRPGHSAPASPDRLPASVGVALQPQSAASGSSSRTEATARTFSWPAVPSAVAYEFILLRGQERVFARRILTPRLTLPASWRYRGKQRVLRPGIYRWIVLPVRSRAAGPMGKAVVAARLVID